MARKRFLDEASAAALVRYGPELSVLKQLMSESGTSYRQKVHSAAAGASAIEASAARGLEQLKGIYPEAIGGIPGLSRVQALNDMAGRGVAAQESAAGARRTALTELAADRAKITGRRSDIAQEIGAFTTSEAGKLSDKAAQRDLTNRISIRGIRSKETEGAKNRATTIKAAKIRSAKSPTRTASVAKQFEDKYGVKPQTTVAHSALRSKVDSALAVINDQFDKGNRDRRLLAKWLTVGRESQTVDVNGNKVKVPGISKTDPAAASIALDMAFNNHVSDGNADRLHHKGYSVKALGFPGSTEKLRQDREKERKRAKRQKAALSGALANAFGPFGSTA